MKAWGGLLASRPKRHAVTVLLQMFETELATEERLGRLIIIQHRVNDVESLLKTPKHMGVEVDVRSNAGGMFLAHDPFVLGTLLQEYLDSFEHAFIVLNVKEEGLEDNCLSLLRERGISDYFFLDQPIPTLVRRGSAGMKDGACRISEYETLSTVENLSKFCDWVWVDSFHLGAISIPTLEQLRKLNLKICLVSPELHDPARAKEIHEGADSLFSRGIYADAVCTKFPAKWESEY